MSDWKQITMADLQALPVGYRQTISEEYLDANNHMNVMWYTHLFARSLEDFFKRVGLTYEYFAANQVSTFALASHTRYYNEVRVAQQVTVRTRAIARSDRRFHLLHFMTNDDRQVLAATMEGLGTHVDLRVRRSAPFPPAVMAAFDKMLEEHKRLPWPAPLCGALKV